MKYLKTIGNYVTNFAMHIVIGIFASLGVSLVTLFAVVSILGASIIGAFKNKKITITVKDLDQLKAAKDIFKK